MRSLLPTFPRVYKRSVALFAATLLSLVWIPVFAGGASAASTATDFSQCANGTVVPHDCSWINGDIQPNNSKVAEGMSTLQRLVIANVPATASHTHSLVFHTSFTKGGLHSYDFLTSWDQAVAAASYYQIPFHNLNPCVGVPGTTCNDLRTTGTLTAVDVPDDPFVSHSGSTQTRINQYESLFNNRTVSFYTSGAVTNASLASSHSVANGADTGDSDMTWTLTWTGDVTNLMLNFGAHVSKGVGLTGWGAGTGASSIPGSPYHVSLDTIDGASLGSQDNQMKGSTVVVPAIIQVVKHLSPTDDPGLFDLQVAGTSYATGVTNNGTTGQLTFPPGTYNVGEIGNATSGTDLSNYTTSTVCKDGGGTGNTVASGTGHSGVSVTVAEEDSVVCTITNTRIQGKITVNKSIVGDPVGTDRHFSFHVDCPGSVNDQDLPLDLSSSLSGHVDSGDIPIGTACTVTESGTHTGYTVTSSPTDGSVTVPGHVDFTNTRDTGKIRINKSIVGDPASSTRVFNFHVDCSPGSTYDQNLQLDLSSALSGHVDTGDIPTGLSCTVTEGSHPGYTVTISNDGVATVPGSVDVTNTRDTGVITVNKSLVGDPSAAQRSFTFHVDCPVDTYDQDITINLSNSTSGSNTSTAIPVGMQCTVSEGTHTGWTVVSVPSDGSVTVPGHVDFTNTRVMGKITVNKTLVGDPSSASTSFTFHVDCPVDTYDQNIVLNLGATTQGSAQSTDIPSGMQCTVTELTHTGWTVTSAPADGSVTVPGHVDFTNTRIVGKITVNKSLVGDPLGASTSFTFHVDCPVDTYDQNVVLNLGANTQGSAQSTDIPSGMQCTVTEGTHTGWTVTSAPADGSVTVPGHVDFTNTRNTGAIEVDKSLVGDPSGDAIRVFTFHVNCPGENYDQDLQIDLTNGTSGSALSSQIPTGVVCTVTEGTHTGWAVTVAPDNGQVTVPGVVSFVNTRNTGVINIVKNRVGDPAGASTTFTFHIDCPGATYDQKLVLDLSQNASGSVQSDAIPTGVVCTVTEDGVTGWSTTSVPSNGSVTSPGSITFTNTRDTGQITVNKSLVGDPQAALRSFTFHADCDGSAYDQDILLDLSSATSGSATSGQIPTGVHCTVTEGTHTGWTVTVDPQGGGVTVPGSVTFTNTRDVGKITVNKTLVGDALGASTSFLFHVDCPDTTYDQDVPLDLGNSTQGSAQSGDIPTGVQCTVSEGTHTGWSVTVDPQGGGVTVPGSVSFTNTRNTGVITVNKSIVGDPIGTNRVFTFHVDCTGTAYDQDVTVDLSAALSGGNTTGQIPTGLVCTVTEGTHTGYTVTVSPENGQATVPGSVSFTNTRDTGVITVDKALVGDPTGASTTFTFHVDCPGTDYDQDLMIALGSSTSGSTSSSAIPTGLACTVAEGTHTGWTVTVDSEGGSVTVPGTIHFTNTRNTGVITIDKSLVGDPTGASTDFTFHVDCPGTAYDQDVSLSISQGDSGSATTGQIPSGLSCTVTEGDHAGWTATVSPTDGSVDVGGTVSFTNTRDTGIITVDKAIVGTVAGASTEFVFDVICPSAPAYNQQLTIDASTHHTATSTPIPTGIECSVTEESTPGWQQTTPAEGGVDVTVPGSASFTNTRLTGALQLAKSVTPSSGSYNPSDANNTLTYTLRLTSTGQLDHTGVVVTDIIPGFDPGDTKSGKTSYVSSSATCSTHCVATYNATTHTLSWAVGDVAHSAGAVVLTFKVRITAPASFDPAAGIPTEVIDNIGFVQSVQQPRTPSNQVKTPVTAVLGVKVVRPPRLPFTGVPAQEMLLGGLALLGAGIILTSVRRRREH